MKALEEAKKEASLTYKDCVKKYKASEDFLTVVEERTGEYHGMGIMID